MTYNCDLCGHQASMHKVIKESKLKDGSWDVLGCPKCPDGKCRKR